MIERAAKAFEKQFIENPVKENKLAQVTFERGMTRLKEFEEKGYVTIELKWEYRLQAFCEIADYFSKH